MNSVKLFFLSTRLDYNQWRHQRAAKVAAKADKKQKELQSEVVALTNVIKGK